MCAGDAFSVNAGRSCRCCRYVGVVKQTRDEGHEDREEADEVVAVEG